MVSGANKEKFQFNEPKFIELVLYIADKCRNDPDFGATKLNKILFYSDFNAYGNLGKPITGATYFKLPYGPAPRQLLDIRDQMIRNDEIVVQSKDQFDYQQQRIKPLRNANLKCFSTEEINIVNGIIGIFCGINASGSSRLSHSEIGWQVADEEEDIPYETVFLSNSPLISDEIKHGLELAKKYGWSI